MENIAIGIDLGTVNSVLAVHRNNVTEIIQNEDMKITPSFVYYDIKDISDVTVGDDSKALAHPCNGIYDVKRMIGRSYEDEWIQKYMHTYQFKIEPDTSFRYEKLNMIDFLNLIKSTRKHGIKIAIKQNDETFYKTPQEVSAEILKKFKEIASEHLNREVTEAVITVPAYFNFSQRNATKKAAELAGLKVLMLLNEPTAAALSYISERVEDDTMSLVFDLGGGTFDISIVRLTKNCIRTVAVDGDTFLGGRNFDEILFDYVVKKNNLNLGDRQSRRLRTALEEIKKKLSYKTEISTVLEQFFQNSNGNNVFKVRITRQEFESINSDLFKKCIDIVERCLREAHIQKSDIKEVILVGGSSKIPKIHNMVKNYFDGRQPLTDLNPDEAVASGAAIQAASMKGLGTVKFNIQDVTPFSLGIETYGGMMVKMFKNNQIIPAKHSENFTTVDNYQKSISFAVYEGERSQCSLNNFLGRFNITDFPIKPMGEVNILVTFTIDESGLLKVTAKEKTSGASSSLEVGVELFDLRNKYVVSLVDESEQDRLFEEFVNLKFNLRSEFVKYVANKDPENDKVLKCVTFIEDIDEVNFDEKEKLDKLVETFKKEINDEKLIKMLNYERIKKY